MKDILTLLLLATLIVAGTPVRAQKPFPIELLGLLGKLSIPENAAACYGGSTHAIDPANGAVSVTNTNPTFKEINDQLEKIKAQSMNPQLIATAQLGQPMAGAPSSAEIAIIKQLGQAQAAAGRINQLMLEMGQKLGSLDKSGIDKVDMGPNCPEVQQGGYAGPTCDCMKKKDVTYQTKRIAAYNLYLQQVKAVLIEYLAKIKVEAAIVDNFEHIAKFGDAVSNPVYKQLVGSVQGQALGGVAGLLGACQGNWEDAAKMYAHLVNANSGASVGCFGR